MHAIVLDGNTCIDMHFLPNECVSLNFCCSHLFHNVRHIKTRLQIMLLLLSAISPCALAEWGGSGFITSGQRVIYSDCSSKWAWMPNQVTSIPFNYTNWGTGLTVQPDCQACSGDQHESCMQYWSGVGYQWNDFCCTGTGCPVCQFDFVLWLHCLVPLVQRT